jgi:hypothetical protein
MQLQASVGEFIGDSRMKFRSGDARIPAPIACAAKETVPADNERNAGFAVGAVHRELAFVRSPSNASIDAICVIV